MDESQASTIANVSSDEGEVSLLGHPTVVPSSFLAATQTQVPPADVAIAVSTKNIGCPPILSVRTSGLSAGISFGETNAYSYITSPIPSLYIEDATSFDTQSLQPTGTEQICLRSPFPGRSLSQGRPNSIARASTTMLAGLRFRIAYTFEGWRVIEGKRHETRGVETWIEKCGGTFTTDPSETVHFLIVPKTWPTERSSTPASRLRISQYIINAEWLFRSIQIGKLIPPAQWDQIQRFDKAAFLAKQRKSPLGFPFGLEVTDGEWGLFCDRWATIYAGQMVWMSCDTSNVECRQCWRRYPARDSRWNGLEKRWECTGIHDVEYIKQGFDRDLSTRKLRDFVMHLGRAKSMTKSDAPKPPSGVEDPLLRIVSIRYPCCIGRFAEHMGELIDHHSRTATSSDTEFAPSQMADVWRLELTAIKVDGGIDLLVTDEPGNFSRYLHTGMIRGRLATINVMQDRAPGVQYVILVLVAVPKSHEDGSVSQETHMGINFWPPTARPEDLRTCLLAIFDTYKTIIAECPVPFKVVPKLSLDHFATITHCLWETAPPGLTVPVINRTERYIGRGDQAEGIWETLPERK